jgi:hypothetical protein
VVVTTADETAVDVAVVGASVVLVFAAEVTAGGVGVADD